MTKLEVQEIKRFIRGGNGEPPLAGSMTRRPKPAKPANRGAVDPYEKKPGAKVGAGQKGGTVAADRRRPR
jgi:hypothetical protein